MPLLDAATIRPYLDGGDFRRLFTQRLGWNSLAGAPLPVTVDGLSYALQPVAEKAHFTVYRCSPGPDGALPNSSVRAKIDNRVTRLQQLHLIIYVDQAGSAQVWQWVRSGRFDEALVRREVELVEAGDEAKELFTQLALAPELVEFLTPDRRDATLRGEPLGRLDHLAIEVDDLAGASSRMRAEGVRHGDEVRSSRGVSVQTEPETTSGVALQFVERAK